MLVPHLIRHVHTVGLDDRTLIFLGACLLVWGLATAARSFAGR